MPEETGRIIRVRCYALTRDVMTGSYTGELPENRKRAARPLPSILWDGKTGKIYNWDVNRQIVANAIFKLGTY